jgi:glutamate carboxypeptidase
MTGAGDDLTRLLLDDLRPLVERESPSEDPVAVGRCAELIAGYGAALLGAAPERLDRDGHPHLRWQWPAEPGPASAGRVLLLCHFDTVWPVGTLTRMPWSVQGDVLRGPGTYDMKAGLVMAVRALAELRAGLQAGGLAGVTLLCTSDEEIGSPSSRDLIEAQASQADVALVLEAAGPEGALKTARKGVGMYRLHVDGRAAHAGVEPERGINAGVELAHQVLAAGRLADADAGTSVVPTRAAAGTTINTVPGQADLHIDSRAWTVEEQRRVDAALRGLAPQLPGARLTLAGGINRPPLTVAAARPVFARAVEVAARLGLPEPRECGVGGGSDGNFTAGVGTLTLDGLGPVGGGAHADDEHVLVQELAPRTRFLAALVRSLLTAPLRLHG